MAENGTQRKTTKPTTRKAAAKRKPAAKRKATTRTKRKPAAGAGKTGAATRASRSKGTARKPKASRGASANLPKDLLKSLEDGQKAAIDAVRKFLDTVEGALPMRENPPKRQEVVDSAMEMTDRLVKTQYEFLRKVVQSASKTLGDSARRR